MSFYDRYASACQKNHIDPCGADIAKALEINKSTASSWKKSGAAPHGAIIRRIADYFHVSADYLLERVDDYTDPKDVPPELSRTQKELIELCEQLDQVDYQEILNYIKFKLQNEKYKKAGETA